MMTCETLNPFAMRFAHSTNRPFCKLSRISDCGLQPLLPSYLFFKGFVDTIDVRESKGQCFLRGSEKAHYPDFVFSSTISGASSSPDSADSRFAAIAVFLSSYTNR